jgi:hypothetical protein
VEVEIAKLQPENEAFIPKIRTILAVFTTDLAALLLTFEG